MKKNGHPKSARLCAGADFKAVLEHKLFARNGLMTLYAKPNADKKTRFGVSVSSKTASAVGRNRLKRLSREAFRLNRDAVRSNFDYLIIFSPLLSRSKSCDINKLSLKDVRGSFLELLERIYKRIEN
ncbi:MAG: ribonuclease P protein component [Phycisphaerae bacterium]|jgi:ribonuclease P protein component|nr:MAG: ribonuclease P protein component [Planctomycetes bacterium GWC2_45_44]HBG78341.1 ribonuclease P protein component [Phycisphaerales bacterium]HBR19913.1 ribonuclease P protein component [Phycisphaerales bacterium]